jgi:hypothetical protein
MGSLCPILANRFENVNRFEKALTRAFGELGRLIVQPKKDLAGAPPFVIVPEEKHDTRFPVLVNPSYN